MGFRGFKGLGLRGLGGLYRGFGIRVSGFRGLGFRICRILKIGLGNFEHFFQEVSRLP